MNIDSNHYLGGHLVGIGKITKSGEVIYNKLEKPIHNRITSVGLDHLFQFSGSAHPNVEWRNSYSSSAVGFASYFVGKEGNSSKASYRAGVLEYVAFGNGTSSTNFDDTTLASQIGGYSDTKYYGTASTGLCGSIVNSFGNLSHKITHQSATVSETTTINEIGWFGAYDTTSSYSNKVLFARVVLPSPITLQAGEYLLTTYQLDETISNNTETTINDFFGLKDPNGNTLQAAQKIARYCSGMSSTNSPMASTPFITKTGEGGYSASAQMTPTCFYPVYCYNEVKSQISYNTSSSKTFPTDGDYVSSMTYFDSSYSDFNGGTSSYNGVGSTNKYRDITYISGAFNPNMESNPAGYQDIYFIVANGMCYRFGYYDNGTWVPQALRKYANKQLTFTFRVRYSTADTTLN
jgi:hypothetical protein